MSEADIFNFHIDSLLLRMRMLREEIETLQKEEDTEDEVLELKFAMDLLKLDLQKAIAKAR
jgi:hypothetical protein